MDRFTEEGTAELARKRQEALDACGEASTYDCEEVGIQACAVAEKLPLETNIPQELALQFPQSREVESAHRRKA